MAVQQLSHKGLEGRIRLPELETVGNGKAIGNRNMQLAKMQLESLVLMQFEKVCDLHGKNENGKFSCESQGELGQLSNLLFMQSIVYYQWFSVVAQDSVSKAFETMEDWDSNV